MCCMLRKEVKQSSHFNLIWHFPPPSLEKKLPIGIDQDIVRSVVRKGENPSKEQYREKMRDFYNKRKPKTRIFDIPPSR